MIDCVVIFNLHMIKAVETHESWGLAMRMENCDQIHLHYQELEAATPGWGARVMEILC